MKRSIILFLTMCLLVLIPPLVLAQGPLPEVDPSAAGAGLSDSLKTGGVVLGIAFGGQLLIWLLRIFLFPNLGGKALAWFATISIGLAAGFSVLAMNPSNWVNAILAALAAGLGAGKAWDLMPDGTKKNGKLTLKARMKAPIHRKRNERIIA